ncbi:MAG: radical SAM protein [Dehalococcoidia bacterium]|nr:radical SAM protein [Dehalococcoidia bacterium]
MTMGNYTASYLTLFRSGELNKRAARLAESLSSCELCPRRCGAVRAQGELGFCRSGVLPVVSSSCAHHGEEPVLSGTHGSGTIFFGNCNLRCAFCQNYQISQAPDRQKVNEVSLERLAEIMLSLQAQGCHNINLVSPTHFVPQIVQALALAAPQGLNIPLVYNTNAYDSLTTLRELSGIIDIYLPDLKYATDENAEKYSQAPNYPQTARAAIREMFRQVGILETDTDDIAERGVIVRHLILPHNAAGTEESLQWLAHEVSPDITVSLMSQYYPIHRATQYPELARPITAAEHAVAERSLAKAGIENGWVQDPASPENYLPDFTRPGHPFGS